MEEVLEVYKRPYDPSRPVICMDEGSKQLERAKRAPLPMQPGQSRREDYEYEREGYWSVFVACEPLAGQRFLQVRERRTRQDWACFLRELLEEHYPDAHKVVLVMDNLNTHTPASLYATFPAAEAWRLRERLEIHYTPKHGSWLNMAELELSVVGRQVLHDRMSTFEEVSQRVAAWQARRNQQQRKISWQFTTQDARIKLRHLYPSFEA